MVAQPFIISETVSSNYSALALKSEFADDVKTPSTISSVVSLSDEMPYLTITSNNFERKPTICEKYDLKQVMRAPFEVFNFEELREYLELVRRFADSSTDPFYHQQLARGVIHVLVISPFCSVWFDTDSARIRSLPIYKLLDLIYDTFLKPMARDYQSDEYHYLAMKPGESVLQFLPRALMIARRHGAVYKDKTSPIYLEKVKNDIQRIIRCMPKEWLLELPKFCPTYGDSVQEFHTAVLRYAPLMQSFIDENKARQASLSTISAQPVPPKDNSSAPYSTPFRRQSERPVRCHNCGKIGHKRGQCAQW